MKRLPLLLLLLVATLALGIGAYAVSRHCMMAEDHTGRAELQWLRAEYKLNDAQYARIVALHQDYKPRCDQYCEAIVAKRETIDHLIRENKQVTPELTRAFADEAALRSACRLHMLEHVYAVSREMDPAQGRRYLEMMSTQITCPAEMTGQPGATSHHGHQ